MAAYDFCCPEHGSFEIVARMGTAGQRVDCPRCGRGSPRVFTAPMLGLADRRVGAVVDRAERSRERPEVVTTLPTKPPSKRPRVAPPNPALKRLPRP